MNQETNQEKSFFVMFEKPSIIEPVSDPLLRMGKLFREKEGEFIIALNPLSGEMALLEHNHYSNNIYRPAYKKILKYVREECVRVVIQLYTQTFEQYQIYHPPLGRWIDAKTIKRFYPYVVEWGVPQPASE